MAFSPTAPAALDRATLLVDHARELANDRGDAAFTIADVVRRAGVSLKGFYATFASKDDLLVALLAQDSRRGALLVGAAADHHADADARLQTWIRELLVLAALPEAHGYAALLARETRRLADTQPVAIGRALDPLLTQLRELLGSVGSHDTARDSLTVFDMLLDAVNRVAKGTVEPVEHAQYLSHFVLGALCSDPNWRKS